MSVLSKVSNFIRKLLVTPIQKKILEKVNEFKTLVHDAPEVMRESEELIMKSKELTPNRVASIEIMISSLEDKQNLLQSIDVDTDLIIRSVYRLLDTMFTFGFKEIKSLKNKVSADAADTFIDFTDNELVGIRNLVGAIDKRVIELKEMLNAG